MYTLLWYLCVSMGERGGECGSLGRTVLASSKVITDVEAMKNRTHLHDQEVVQRSRGRSGRGWIEVLQVKGRGFL